MTAISGYGRPPQPNLLAERGERVFLCRSAAEKSHQLRSRGTQRLAVRNRVRLAFSLAAALLDGTFEQLTLQTNPKAVNA
jgi:hypothetical protein